MCVVVVCCGISRMWEINFLSFATWKNECKSLSLILKHRCHSNGIHKMGERAVTMLEEQGFGDRS